MIGLTVWVCSGRVLVTQKHCTGNYRRFLDPDNGFEFDIEAVGAVLRLVHATLASLCPTFVAEFTKWCLTVANVGWVVAMIGGAVAVHCGRPKDDGFLDAVPGQPDVRSVVPGADRAGQGAPVTCILQGWPFGLRAGVSV